MPRRISVCAPRPPPRAPPDLVPCNGLWEHVRSRARLSSAAVPHANRSKMLRPPRWRSRTPARHTLSSSGTPSLTKTTPSVARPFPALSVAGNGARQTLVASPQYPQELIPASGPGNAIPHVVRLPRSTEVSPSIRPYHCGSRYWRANLPVSRISGTPLRLADYQELREQLAKATGGGLSISMDPRSQERCRIRGCSGNGRTISSSLPVGMGFACGTLITFWPIHCRCSGPCVLPSPSGADLAPGGTAKTSSRVTDISRCGFHTPTSILT